MCIQARKTLMCEISVIGKFGKPWRKYTITSANKSTGNTNISSSAQKRVREASLDKQAKKPKTAAHKLGNRRKKGKKTLEKTNNL
jgi:hypothetical protein